MLSCATDNKELWFMALNQTGLLLYLVSLRLLLFSLLCILVESAYKGLVRPTCILEYSSSVWDPHYEGLTDDLEKVQKRTARFVSRNHTYVKGSMTDIFKNLYW